MVHILLLTQFTKSAKSKEWADFTSIHDCCKHVCKLFENSLKKQNPFLAEITYDITDLYDFVDNVSSIFFLKFVIQDNP